MGARGAIDIFFSERLQETNRGFPGRSYIPFPPTISSIFFCILFGEKNPVIQGRKNIFPLSNGIKIKKVLWCKGFLIFHLDFVDFSFCIFSGVYRFFINYQCGWYGSMDATTSQSAEAISRHSTYSGIASKRSKAGAKSSESLIASTKSARICL